jgi:hypothetical protein
MSEADELRSIVASEYGLDRNAARLLVGETVEELETSAAALAKLLGERRDQGRAADAPDPFTGAAIAKRARQQALAAALTGRTPRPRDARGRFTGFDGGARQRVARRPETHDEWLVKLLRTRAADAGARF